jgi:hypothetical protein
VVRPQGSNCIGTLQWLYRSVHCAGSQELTLVGYMRTKVVSWCVRRGVIHCSLSTVRCSVLAVQHRVPLVELSLRNLTASLVSADTRPASRPPRGTCSSDNCMLKAADLRQGVTSVHYSSMDQGFVLLRPQTYLTRRYKTCFLAHGFLPRSQRGQSERLSRAVFIKTFQGLVGQWHLQDGVSQ